MKKEDNANLPVPSFTKLQNIGLTAEDFDIKNENLRSRILIEDLKIYAYHGVLPEEKTIGTHYLVNAEIHADLWKAAQSDHLEELSDNEWNLLQETINKAVIEFSNFRKTEGEILGEELIKNIKNIEELLGQVLPFEEERISTIKERYLSSLKDFEQLDETRFYQEVAYFVEKLDISEEKVRLTQHLKYFLEVLNNEDFNGKKLGFISQEIGREINTLGSKANHHEIQKIVVMMKDNLEKIKEQTLNVL